MGSVSADFNPFHRDVGWGTGERKKGTAKRDLTLVHNRIDIIDRYSAVFIGDHLYKLRRQPI